MQAVPRAAAMLQDEWGHGLGNPIAVLHAEPAELTRGTGIAFTDGHDDLDSVRIALFKATSGGEYALLRHTNAPRPGTEVLARTDAYQPQRFAADLRELLGHLKLEGDAVAWLAPQIERAWRALAPTSVRSTRAPARRRLGKRSGSRRGGVVATPKPRRRS